jgi:hypothetical protein
MHWNCVCFLKTYLFIYRTDVFWLFPSHLQGACYYGTIEEQCVYHPRYNYFH